MSYWQKNIIIIYNNCPSLGMACILANTSLGYKFIYSYTLALILILCYQCQLALLPFYNCTLRLWYKAVEKLLWNKVSLHPSVQWQKNFLIIIRLNSFPILQYRTVVGGNVHTFVSDVFAKGPSLSFSCLYVFYWFFFYSYIQNKAT